MSTKKPITRGCCIKTCMSTNLDKQKKNFYSIPNPNRYRQKHERWLAAIRLVNGADWEPKMSSDKVCSAHFSKGRHSQIQWDLDYVPHIFKNNFVKFKKKENYTSTTSANDAETTEENDENEDIDVTGIDLPSTPNCSQLDFDMLTMSQSILEYVKQQDGLNSQKHATENPSNLPEMPPETPTKSNNEGMIFESFPSRF